MKNVVVAGLGEVGEAIKKIEEEAGNEAWVREIRGEYPQPPEGTKIDVLHVCIPFIPEFQDRVVEWSKFHKPALIIIHSTVPLGITKEIGIRIKQPIVHSPVRGVHPNLYGGLLTFKKLVGGDDASAKLACEHLKSININPEHIGRSENTELSKILSTTYYGWNILYAKLVKELCEEFGLDYEKVYTIPNETYNEGYKKLGMEHVVRPVLTPPRGRIGGHCVTQNFDLLPPSKIKQVVKDINDQ